MKKVLIVVALLLASIVFWLFSTDEKASAPAIEYKGEINVTDSGEKIVTFSATSSSNPSQTPSKLQAYANQVIVSKLDSVTHAQLSNALNKFGITIDRQIASFPFYVVAFPVDDIDDVIQAVNNIDSLMGDYIDGYDLNHIHQSFQNAQPTTFPKADGWGPENIIKVEQAWEHQASCEGVKIGVIDSAFLTNHDDLQGIFKEGSGLNAITLTKDIEPKDSDRYPTHGTQVSCLVAANRNNIGRTGICPGAEIIGVKVASEFPKIWSDEYALIAIQHMLDSNVDVVNYSLAKEYKGIFTGLGILNFEILNSPMLKAIDMLGQKGIPFVTAAGNKNLDLDWYPVFPAGHQTPSGNIVTVGATRLDGSWADNWSNDGGSNYSDTKVTIAAPGDSLRSCTVKRDDNGIPASAWTERAISGTSYSTPIITGAIGLYIANLKSEGKAIPSANDIRLRLMSTAVKDQRISDKVASGIVDVEALLTEGKDEPTVKNESDGKFYVEIDDEGTVVSDVTTILLDYDHANKDFLLRTLVSNDMNTGLHQEVLFVKNLDGAKQNFRPVKVSLTNYNTRESLESNMLLNLLKIYANNSFPPSMEIEINPKKIEREEIYKEKVQENHFSTSGEIESSFLKEAEDSQYTYKKINSKCPNFKRQCHVYIKTLRTSEPDFGVQDNDSIDAMIEQSKHLSKSQHVHHHGDFRFIAYYFDVQTGVKMRTTAVVADRDNKDNYKITVEDYIHQKIDLSPTEEKWQTGGVIKFDILENYSFSYN